jgi:phosphoglycerol transferase MdoB-like AlkP superfamily enzyme
MSKSRQNIPAPIINDPRLKMVQRVTRLMDEQFSIGGFKFGLDPVLNLIPVAGDVSSYIISVALIITMAQHGASGRVAMKMLGNATLDALVGTIPVLGWIFDFSYKANTRNLKLLTEHYTEGKHRGSAKPVIISILVIMLLVLTLLVYLVIKLFQWLEALIMP